MIYSGHVSFLEYFSVISCLPLRPTPPRPAPPARPALPRPAPQIFSRLLTHPAHMQVVYPLQKRPRHLQHRSSGLFERHGNVIGASSSDAGGDASSSNPGSAAAVAVPKARVPAPSVSEDEDGAALILPAGEGSASVGDQ